MSLAERHRILGMLATAYADSAAYEVGLQKAKDIPRVRRELKSRYGARVGKVVGDARAKAQAQRLAAEAEIPSLTQADALKEAGFMIDPDTADHEEPAEFDPETENQKTTIKLRQAMGPGRPGSEAVSQKDRDAFMASIYTPEPRSDGDAQKTA